MNEVDMKQLFDVIFMMVISFVMAISLAYGLYKGASILWKQHKKNKVLKRIQFYIKNGQFQKVITFNHEGLPILVEIVDKKEKKIITV